MGRKDATHLQRLPSIGHVTELYASDFNLDKVKIAFVCCWHCFFPEVNRKYKMVSALALPYHRIQGSFSDAVANHFSKLKGLCELHLVGNELRGRIPEEINTVTIAWRDGGSPFTRRARLVFLRARVCVFYACFSI